MGDVLEFRDPHAAHRCPRLFGQLCVYCKRRLVRREAFVRLSRARGRVRRRWWPDRLRALIKHMEGKT